MRSVGPLMWLVAAVWLHSPMTAFQPTEWQSLPAPPRTFYHDQQTNPHPCIHCRKSVLNSCCTLHYRSLKQPLDCFLIIAALNVHHCALNVHQGNRHPNAIILRCHQLMHNMFAHLHTHQDHKYPTKPSINNITTIPILELVKITMVNPKSHQRKQ